MRKALRKMILNSAELPVGGCAVVCVDRREVLWAVHNNRHTPTMLCASMSTAYVCCDVPYQWSSNAGITNSILLCVTWNGKITSAQVESYAHQWSDETNVKNKQKQNEFVWRRRRKRCEEWQQRNDKMNERKWTGKREKYYEATTTEWVEMCGKEKRDTATEEDEEEKMRKISLKQSTFSCTSFIILFAVWMCGRGVGALCESKQNVCNDSFRIAKYHFEQIVYILRDNLTQFIRLFIVQQLILLLLLDALSPFHLPSMGHSHLLLRLFISLIVWKSSTTFSIIASPPPSTFTSTPLRGAHDFHFIFEIVTTSSMFWESQVIFLRLISVARSIYRMNSLCTRSPEPQWNVLITAASLQFISGLFVLPLPHSSVQPSFIHWM